MPSSRRSRVLICCRRLISAAGLIVPRRNRGEWKREWEAEIEHRWARLQDWQRLDYRAGLDLLNRSRGAFSDAGWIQLQSLREGFFQDVRYGSRLLIKRPGFALVAMSALAFGIGANTLVFSVVNATLLRPLPYEDPEKLVVLWETKRDTGGTHSVSYPNYRDWQGGAQSFRGIAAYSLQNFTMTGMGGAEQIKGEWVSANYFEVLGVQALRGRSLLPHENETPGSHPVVMLSHAFWQRRMGGDDSAVGKTIIINGRDLTVVGILPEGFKGYSAEAEVWIPMMMFNALFPDIARFDIPNDRGTHWHQAFARLRPEVTLEGAQAELDTLAAGLEQQYPKSNSNYGVKVVSAREELFGDLRPALFVLLGAVGFVLLIACANVANLLLARAAVRRKEIAIRLALGAGRLRLVRQLLTESLLMAILGGAGGLALAWWGIKALPALSPVRMPGFVSLGIDARVLLFTLSVSAFTGLLFGLAPALAGTRPVLTDSLTLGGRGGGGDLKGTRVRSLLVISEVSLSLILLIGAGLMVRSFQRMQEFDVGFRPDHLLTARFSLPSSKYSEAEQPRVRDRIAERVGALPDVQAVAISSHVFFGSGYLSGNISVEGQAQEPSGSGLPAYQQYVSPGFFEAMGLPLLAGRAFAREDIERALNVVVVSDALAQRCWPGESPLGKRIKRGKADSKNPWLEVVGVVRDAKPRVRLAAANDASFIYIPLTQGSGWTSSPALLIRTGGDPAALIPALMEAAREIDADIPLYDIASMERRVGDQTSELRFNALLMSLFAALSLLLGAVGVYGVISYSVSQRLQEIGIRIALGARPRDILGLVLARGMTPVIAGVVIGLTAALALTRVMSSLLFGVSSTDLTTFSLVPALLMVVALLACYIPARRAMKVDPITALRCE
jgi:putative ABC transport system permease protein